MWKPPLFCVSKHNRSQIEKEARNLLYATKYRNRKCKKCGHKSSRPGKCKMCGGEMRAKGAKHEPN